MRHLCAADLVTSFVICDEHTSVKARFELKFLSPVENQPKIYFWGKWGQK